MADLAEQPEETVVKAGMVATGATYRQIDYWTRRGYLRPHLRRPDAGSGYPRAWSVAERDVCALMIRLTDAGIDVEVAAAAARRAVESGADTVRLPGGVWVAWTPWWVVA